MAHQNKHKIWFSVIIVFYILALLPVHKFIIPTTPPSLEELIIQIQALELETNNKNDSFSETFKDSVYVLRAMARLHPISIEKESSRGKDQLFVIAFSLKPSHILSNSTIHKIITNYSKLFYSFIKSDFISLDLEPELPPPIYS